MASSRPAPPRPRTLRVLVDPPARGAWNMALDEALLDAASKGGVTLRLYGWDPPGLSFGRNESVRGRYDAARAARRGVDFVRRPTGGRTVYHDRELTYAVAAPERLWGGPRETYARIHRALGRGLRRLGVPVEEVVDAPDAAAGSDPAPGHLAGETAACLAGETAACFAAAAPGELTALGRKLVGSALWRRAGALLQHGSLLLSDDQGMVEALRVDPVPWPEGGGESGGETGRPVSARPASIGLAEACGGAAPPLDALVEALVEGFEAEFELRALITEASSAERRAARTLAERYADPAWTWRR